MVKDRPGRSKTARRTSENINANLVESHWLSAPDSPVSVKSLAGTVVRAKISVSSVNDVSSSRQGRSEWVDAFDMSPWVGGGAEQGGTYVPSQEISNKLRARRLRLQAEGAEGYTNPWNEPDVATRATASRSDEVVQPEKIPDENKYKGGTRPQTVAGGEIAGSDVSATEPETLYVGPCEIPVEDLANGVVNALGDGLGAVIHTGASAGRYIVTGVQVGVKKVASGTVAGAVAVASVGMVCEFTSILTGRVYDPWD